MTVADALALALSLPNVEKGTAYGAPAVKTGGQMFACKTTHRSAEPNSLAVRLSFEDRDALIAEEPGTYYLKEHYVDYPCVLVRLDKVHPDAMRDLLTAAHRFVTEKARAKRGAAAAPRKRRSRRSSTD